MTAAARRRGRRPAARQVAAAGASLLLVAGGAALVLDRDGTRDGTGTGSGTGGGGAVTADRTRFGASFQTLPGEGYARALARTDATLGSLDLVRVFYPGQPDPWPGKAPGRDVVVSFKLDPRAVLAGEHDASMREWFATVPAGLDVYWTYWHEPEDDVEDGAFTAADYRAAFAHLDGLADEAGSSRLTSTVILMSWSTRPQSGRDWRDFLPDPDSVDVLAWDVYNRAGNRGIYSSPAELLGAARQAAAAVDRPFAVAELGSIVVDGDDGSGRAKWLRSVGAYLNRHGAAFATYFDFTWNGGADDYRLRDAPSVQAWKDISGG